MLMSTLTKFQKKTAKTNRIIAAIKNHLNSKMITLKTIIAQVNLVRKQYSQISLSNDKKHLVTLKYNMGY